MTNLPAIPSELLRPVPWRAVSWRLRQFIASATSQPDTSVDHAIRSLLRDDRLWALLAPLTPFDRAHHLRVHHALLAAGHTDPDLLLAALLHDVGKADDTGRAGIPARALRVLLRRTPSLLARLTRERHPRLLHGLYLAEHHARLGAERARSLGVSERCCWLIAHHEDLGESQDIDPDLAALIAADDAAIR